MTKKPNQTLLPINPFAKITKRITSRLAMTLLLTIHINMWTPRAKNPLQLVPTLTLRACSIQKVLRIVSRNSWATLTIKIKTRRNHIKSKDLAKCLPYHFWFHQIRRSIQGSSRRILRNIQATMIWIAASIKSTNNFLHSEKTKIKPSSPRNAQGTWIDKAKKTNKSRMNQPKS